MKNIITYLFYNRTFTYISIFLLTGSMITYTVMQNYIQNQIKERIQIENLNKNKQKLIDSKILQLKPLETKLEELKLKIDPLKSCISKLKNSFNTLQDEKCEEKSIISKASAEIIEVNLPQETNTWQTRDQTLMDRVCKYGKLNWKVSPLCNNWQLYNSMKWISEAYNVPFSIALGITYAESHIWVNYAWWCNAGYNNWGGVKWRIWQDWKAIKDQVIPQNWCWVYRFGSVEDYWQSKMRTLQKYNSCFSKGKPITCISYAYVWNANEAEQSWISRVSLISY